MAALLSLDRALQNLKERPLRGPCRYHRHLVGAITTFAEELSESIESWPESILELINIENWNLPALLDPENRSLRKPKIELDWYVNQAGNMVLKFDAWPSDPMTYDFTSRFCWSLSYTRPFAEPNNRIVYIRDFHKVGWSLFAMEHAGECCPHLYYLFESLRRHIEQIRFFLSNLFDIQMQRWIFSEVTSPDQPWQALRVENYDSEIERKARERFDQWKSEMLKDFGMTEEQFCRLVKKADNAPRKVRKHLMQKGIKISEKQLGTLIEGIEKHRQRGIS